MRFGALLLSVVLAPSVQAIEPYSCRNGFFPAFAGEVHHAEVVADAGERVHFRDDGAGCPEAPSCRQKAYLVGATGSWLAIRRTAGPASGTSPKSGSLLAGCRPTISA